MATLTFYLRNDKNPTQVYAYFSVSRNLKFRNSTGFMVNPKIWKNGLPNKKYIDGAELYNILNDLEKFIYSKFNNADLHKNWLEETIREFKGESIKSKNGLNKNSLSVELGFKSNTTIGQIVNGRNNPSFDVMQRIAIRFPEINYHWLLTGRGRMLLEEEYNIISFGENRKTRDGIVPIQDVPIYDLELSAGFNAVLRGENNNVRIINYIRIPGLPSCDGAMYAKGDSMYPLVKSGDLVAFKGLGVEDAFMGEMYVVGISMPNWDDFISVKFMQSLN